jgi:GAF domain-containing protein
MNAQVEHPQSPPGVQALLLVSAAHAETGRDQGASLLASAARRLASALGGGCTIRLRNQSELLVPAAVAHIDPERRAFLYWLTTRFVCSAPGTNAFGSKILHSNEPIFMPEVSSATLRLWTDPALAPYLHRYPVRGLMIVPLVRGRRVAGTLCVWREHPGPVFDECDLAFVEQVGLRLGDSRFGGPRFSSRVLRAGNSFGPPVSKAVEL